ncbi:MAG: hypothetical protein AB7I38_16265 [Dehalococcoidia bacterium]
MAETDDHERGFWELAEPFLRERPGVTRSTMMGLSCLRVDGAFFASCDRTSGALVLKLSEARVDDLLEAGHAEAFSPAGRRFREWAAIPVVRRADWAALLEESYQHVSRSSQRRQQ